VKDAAPLETKPAKKKPANAITAHAMATAAIFAARHPPVVSPPVPKRPLPQRSAATSGSKILPQPALSLDGNTLAKLRRGKIAPDYVLDLHGYRQADAHLALTRTLAQAIARQWRCLLVITGKGAPAAANAPKRAQRSHDADWLQPKSGVLREMVPKWLSEKSMAANIVGVASANQRHGGSGAYYVYLRRNKAQSN
jgi:DNA-nicking Smr family endonuclease